MIDVGRLEAAVAAAGDADLVLTRANAVDLIAELKRLYSRIGTLERGAAIAEICAGMAEGTA